MADLIRKPSVFDVQTAKRVVKSTRIVEGAFNNFTAGGIKNAQSWPRTGGGIYAKITDVTHGTLTQCSAVEVYYNETTDIWTEITGDGKLQWDKSGIPTTNYPVLYEITGMADDYPFDSIEPIVHVFRVKGDASGKWGFAIPYKYLFGTANISGLTVSGGAVTATVTILTNQSLSGQSVTILNASNGDVMPASTNVFCMYRNGTWIAEEPFNSTVDYWGSLGAAPAYALSKDSSGNIGWSDPGGQVRVYSGDTPAYLEDQIRNYRKYADATENYGGCLVYGNTVIDGSDPMVELRLGYGNGLDTFTDTSNDNANSLGITTDTLSTEPEYVLAKDSDGNIGWKATTSCT